MGSHTGELAVLVDQLQELFEQGVTDGDEAVEIAIVAGLATRLGANPALLEPVEAWRRGAGSPLLEQGLAEADIDDLVDAIDDVSGGGVDDEEVDDAVTDFDDLVAAAAWAGRSDLVREAAARVAEIIRTLPDVFACLAEDASTMVRTPTVTADPDLYDYWHAIEEAGEWADSLDDE